MTNENWSTTLSEKEILKSKEGTPVSKLKHPLQNEGESAGEWLRQINSGTPLFINGEAITSQDDFLRVLHEKLKGPHHEVPDSVVQFLINNGAQCGFGWFGFNYIALFAQQFLGIALSLTRNSSDGMTQNSDDTVYDITTRGKELFLTVTTKNIKDFHHMNPNLDPTKTLSLSDEQSITTKTTFRVREKNGKAEYQCISHQDNLLYHAPDILNARAKHIAEMPTPTKNPMREKVARAKFEFLSHTIDFIKQKKPAAQEDFKKNIFTICEDLAKLDTTAIKPMTKYLNGYFAKPGLLKRLWLRLTAWLNPKAPETKSAEITPAPKNSFVKSKFRQIFQSRECKKTEPAPTPTENTNRPLSKRQRIKQCFENVISKLRFKKKSASQETATPGMTVRII